MTTTRTRWFGRSRILALAGAAALSVGHQAGAQQPAPVASPAPASAASAATPALPDLRDIQGFVPRPVRAASALLGMGRQRLALVVGLGTVGGQRVLDSAARDTQAVATALRDGGFVVMQRDDVAAADLRASLREFHDRLQPGGVGFVYVTGLGAQLDGQNLLLPRDAALPASSASASASASAPAPATTAQLRAAGVPLAEVVDALAGTPDSPRLLVVDAAYRHPALAMATAAPGLAEPRLPPGVMVLFGQALGAQHDAPMATPLPTPAPADARDVAATDFARALVGALLTPRINGPDALRNTRRAVFDASQGRDAPWLGGDTDGRDELAEADLLDSMVPRTPEEMARETARQASRLLTKPAGEQSVAQILQQSATASPNPAAGVAGSGNSVGAQGGGAGQPLGANADNAGGNNAGNNSGSSVGSTLGTAVSAIGTVAAVASAAATVANIGAGIKRAETDAAMSLATSAAQTGLAVAGSAAAALLRAASSSDQTPAQSAAPSAAITLATAAPASAAPLVTPQAGTVAPSVAAPVTGAGTAQPTAGLANTTQAGQRAPGAQAVQGPTGAQRLASAAAVNAARTAAETRTTRADGRGERPAYVPRSNPFGYAEGDTFTYRVIDNWTDHVVTEYSTSIDAVLDNGQLLANGHMVQMDPQGRVLRQAAEDGSVSEFQPYQDLWWSKPQRGQSHDVDFTETFERVDHVRGSTAWSGSSSVGRARTLELPAGRYEVLPIESGGWFTETLSNGTRSTGKWSRTVWYSTQLGHPVAIDIEDTDRLGQLLRRERVELLHAQSSRTPPP